MTKCQTCGKLIAKGTAEQLCRACREAERTAAQGEIAATQPLPEPEPIAVPPVDEYICVRCRRHPAIDDSEFCLGCHLELIAALGDAADTVFQPAPAPPQPPIASPASLMSDLEDKRQRTATSHMRLVGGVKIK